MKTRLLIALTALSLSGCAKLMEILSSVDISKYTPTVRFQDVNLRDISFQDADADFVFKVQNPNPIDVKLSSFRYALDIAGASLANGTSSDGLALKSRGDTEMVFPVNLVFQELLDMARGNQGADEVPFAFDGDFGFMTPLGEVKVPYTESGQIPVLQTPKFRFDGIKVENVNLLSQTATLAVKLGVTNQQKTNLSFSNFNYALALGGSDAAITGDVAQLATIGGDTEEVVSLPLEVNLLQLGTTVVNAITKKEPMRVGLDANMSVDTPLGAIPLSVNESGTVPVN